jgi:hypothetical protein
MWRFGGIHYVQCVRLRSVDKFGLMETVSHSAGGGMCVCALTTKLKHFTLKSHAGRLLQNIHTLNCYLYNIFSLSYDLMPRHYVDPYTK